MQRPSVFSLLLLLSTSSTGEAQWSSIALQAESERTVGDDIQLGWEAIEHTLSSPARWNADDWFTFAVVSSTTVASVTFEESVRDVFQAATSDVGDALERVGYWYGSPVFTVPFTVTTYTAGVLFDSDSVRDTGLMMAESLLLVALIQQPLRIVAGRARPHLGLGHLAFRPFTLDGDYASFVSGHAWSAFGISNILARQIDRWWASIGLYALAGIAGLGRMYSDSHWLSDVLVGGASGYFSSTTLWNWHNERAGSEAVSSSLQDATWLYVTFRF
jgi:membrane-associated phospholipid phosphatase